MLDIKWAKMHFVNSQALVGKLSPWQKGKQQVFVGTSTQSNTAIILLAGHGTLAKRLLDHMTTLLTFPTDRPPLTENNTPTALTKSVY